MRILLVSIVTLMMIATVSAQTQSNIVRVKLKRGEIDRIIKKFAENELEFREALGLYAFNRDARVQTIDSGGQITGTFIRNSYLTFNQDGSRFERVLYSPTPTLKDIEVSEQDIDNLGGIDPFAIEPNKLKNYKFTFLGKERIDELDLYVFEVRPKDLPNPRKSDVKFFSGLIWVDDRDLLIVKSRGKALPEGKDTSGIEQRFPIVETWRQQIDGRFWFPVLSTADDELVFKRIGAVKIRVRVKYYNYRQGRTKVRILGEDEVEPTPVVPPTPTPKKPNN